MTYKIPGSLFFKKNISMIEFNDTNIDLIRISENHLGGKIKGIQHIHVFWKEDTGG